MKTDAALVLVSHSERLAEGARELISSMAQDVPILIAAGDGEGGLGTRSEGIVEAVQSANAKHVLLIFDLGSALMNAEMASELLAAEGHEVTVVDAPFVEGAMVAAMALQVGKGVSEAIKEAEASRQQLKKG